ncbi:competence/damage-inducible protein A [uncultured Alistipes sp.]|uniref:competence/damage-inducible protein A n=1 Tax=uncultured Alistipes sp. TaxID=538949 RepID=UPI00260E3814|nr:competence/damage-inducible protein A [uncultured Alistipes sp.]
MQAEIITIGDEILIGQIVDTNSAWMGRELNAAGIKIHRIVSVSDTEDEISRAVTEALSRSEIVLCTGGLGPTKDDLTKHTLARLFGMELVRDEAVFEQVREMTALRHIDFNELNRGQALVPDGCTVLRNRCGTAPGMWFERDGRVLVSMPGVPFEMKTLMQEQVLPRLCEHFRLRAIVHKTAITFGLAESILAESIAPWENALPPYLHLAYLPSAMNIRLRLSAYEVDGDAAAAEIDRQFERLERLLPHRIVGYGDASLESATGALLERCGATVAAAESCTGGNIAHRFTSLPGASAYFRGGVVAYSNEVKTALLGVDPADLERYGAVSRPVAEQMAQGVRRATGATYGIATTGIAGPAGGTPDKPVGTVWMAVAGPEGVCSVRKVFGSLREQNIQRASSHAIDLLRRRLCGAPDDGDPSPC